MKQVKVSVPLDLPKDGYPPAKEELLWCTPSHDNLCVVDNIPFYARDISLGDVISTKRVGNRLKLKKVEKQSENTTLHVFVNNLSDLPALIQTVVSFGGDVEQSDIP